MPDQLMTWIERANSQFQRELDLLRRYVREVHSSLTKAYEDQCSKFSNDVEGLSDDDAQDIFDCYAKGMFNLRDDFVRITTSNTFVAIYTLLEHHMVNICECRRKECGLTVTVDDLHGHGIDACRTYLEKVCDIAFPKDTAEWQKIQRFKRLRNVLVHQRGQVKAGKDAELLAYLAKLPSVKIAYNEIVLDHSFCLEAIDVLQAFMDQVTNAVPTQQRFV